MATQHTVAAVKLEVQVYMRWVVITETFHSILLFNVNRSYELKASTDLSIVVKYLLC